MSIEREKCGCRHNGARYLELCPACRADYDARHAEHLAAMTARRGSDAPGQAVDTSTDAGA